MSSGKVKCTCGWSWNKSDSSKKDMYICHECGRDNSNNMKNGGWLDNYGEEDNYNDYKVSTPEGFVGEGYDATGRNYSPAWGGQFQMGGNVYPVNYVPEAQNGIVTESTAVIKPKVGITMDKSIHNKTLEAKHFLNNWMNSPMYNQMIKQSEPSNYKNLTNWRKHNLRTSEVHYNPLQLHENTAGLSYSSTGKITVLPEGAKLNDVELHELSHSSDRPQWNIDRRERAIPKKDINLINKLKIKNKTNLSDDWLNYVSEPTETRARLNTLRKQSKDQSIYNPFKEKITPNQYKNLLKANSSKKNYNALQQLKNVYSDDQIIQLLNTVSQNDEPSNDVVVAQMGMSIPGATGNFYARYSGGGDIDYPRTKGIPSNGPYAKKTKASAKNGEVIKDDRGQWDYPGEVTEINSNEITMKPDPMTGKKLTRPLIGVSDTGDVKFMKPGKDYKFKGTKVTEYPIAQNGDSFIDKLKAETATRKNKVNTREFKTTTNDNIPNASKMSAKGNEKLVKAIKYEKQKQAKELKEWNALSKDEQERIVYNQRNQKKGSISQYTPQSTLSKAWDIATHPMTAAGYAARNEDLPNNFVKGDINAFESLVNTANPFFYANEASELTNNLYEGNFMNAGFNALNVLPLTAEFSPALRVAGRELGAAAKETGKMLTTLPKAKNIKEAMGALAGLPVEGALPRLSTEELKIFRQAQEIGRLRATGKLTSEQYKYALEQNLPEEHLQRIFGKTKAEVENAIPAALEDEARRAANRGSGSINLQRPPSASTAQQIDRDRVRALMRGWDDDIDAGRELQGSFSDALRMPASSDGVAPIINRGAPRQIGRIEFEGVPNYDYGVLSQLDESTLFSRGADADIRSDAFAEFITQNNFDYSPNRIDQLASKAIDPLKDASKTLKRKFINSLQDYPYYEGPISENVPSLFLRSEGSLKGVSDQVENAATRGMNSGDVYTGSLSTSHNSYLTQLKQGFKSTEGTPQYFGYKRMNNLGFLDELNYSQDDIAKYLNTEIDQQIKRGVIPNNIQRPYVKNGNVQLPHYGIKQFKEGGNIRQEQKGLQNLDQLTNFTNYNTKQPGGWLDQY